METPLYAIPNGVVTRWASPENPDALPGAAGTANHGRKGRPCAPLNAGETLTLAHAEGCGTVRRFWITISERTPATLRGLVLRAYWDGADTPAVEAPLGDFCCQPLGQTAVFQNAWFDNPEGRSFNCRLPMPFRAGFRLTISNESPVDIGALFYDVNFTLGDTHGPEVGYFHAYFHREDPTALRRDFEILPRVQGRGRFLGCSLGVRADMARWGKSWWGEGEVKVYLDGDDALPTLCGTGTEDYIATAWGQGQYAHQWHGCPIADHEHLRYGFYRLHGPDPVYFHRDARVTIQQIGCESTKAMAAFLREHDIPDLVATGDGAGRLTAADLDAQDTYTLFEREDDWSAVAYFYLNTPVSGLPPIQDYAERVAGLEG
jgi:hypothetical protein